ncbi:MAG: HpcH/HpaI aldolase/citrate lyase family protein [Tissierellales bacterium]|nr:HpcH/HpaI aldolase/citrate lyase family protein [Tissierellales bacterium]MBN2827584.1 HpcH/HpaI aldolase/citrate lyase family protein [Tissierellales bacterium]
MMPRLRRSMLFIPGNSPNMIQNAGVLNADSIILDVEDAVSIGEKDSARNLIKNALMQVNFYGCEVVVRVNSPSTAFGMKDLRVLSQSKPDAFMIPMATEKDIIKADQIITEAEKKAEIKEGHIKLIPIAETAYAVENIAAIIKSSNRIEAVLLGAEDLTADLEITRTKDGDEINYARNKISNICKAYRIQAIDTPYADVNDYDGLLKDTIKGKNLGMSGKAAINPRQVDIIHTAYSPSPEEIEYAQNVIKAMEDAKAEGKGVFSYEGKMIDAPIILRAETVIKKAKLAGIL